MTRCINGKFFSCEKPGCWRSDDRAVSIYQIAAKRWQVWVGNVLVGQGTTMTEAVRMWAN
jgi:hypothetical protein